jgi:hypothetical protein
VPSILTHHNRKQARLEVTRISGAATLGIIALRIMTLSIISLIAIFKITLC